METARTLLEHVVARREDPAWASAQALARAVLADPASDDRARTLAKATLEGGPFSINRAVDLAELVLDAAAGLAPGGDGQKRPAASGDGGL